MSRFAGTYVRVADDGQHAVERRLDFGDIFHEAFRHRYPSDGTLPTTPKSTRPARSLRIISADAAA